MSSLDRGVQGSAGLSGTQKPWQRIRCPPRAEGSFGGCRFTPSVGVTDRIAAPPSTKWYIRSSASSNLAIAGTPCFVSSAAKPLWVHPTPFRYAPIATPSSMSRPAGMMCPCWAYSSIWAQAIPHDRSRQYSAHSRSRNPLCSCPP